MEFIVGDCHFTPAAKKCQHPKYSVVVFLCQCYTIGVQKTLEKEVKLMFIILAGGLLIVLLAVVIAVVSSVTSAVAAETDEADDM